MFSTLHVRNLKLSFFMVLELGNLGNILKISSRSEICNITNKYNFIVIVWITKDISRYTGPNQFMIQ